MPQPSVPQQQQQQQATTPTSLCAPSFPNSNCNNLELRCDSSNSSTNNNSISNSCSSNVSPACRNNNSDGMMLPPRGVPTSMIHRSTQTEVTLRQLDELANRASSDIEAKETRIDSLQRVSQYMCIVIF